MLAGHFGLAAVVKARQPQLPLWSLMLATQLLDVIFLVTYALGVERLDPVQGTSGGYGNLIITADYTHSLVGALAISLLATIVTWIFWGRRKAMVIGAVVMSHWLLDMITHRSDLAILPGNAGNLPRLGFGLWQWPWVVAAIELGCASAGRISITTRRRGRRSRPSGGERRQASRPQGTGRTRSHSCGDGGIAGGGPGR